MSAGGADREARRDPAVIAADLDGIVESAAADLVGCNSSAFSFSSNSNRNVERSDKASWLRKQELNQGELVQEDRLRVAVSSEEEKGWWVGTVVEMRP